MKTEQISNKQVNLINTLITESNDTALSVLYTS